jgi:NAD(P)-dependent dehydrogenase (short-subunit alcohol dehydrogenase family)/pimeloyl-ACP methyl ester carboxylesterase
VRTVISSDVRLAVYEQGPPGAPTVLLVHGYPDTHDVWDEVAVNLAARFHVVRYDVRGAGASSAPRGTAAYRLERLKDDLFAVIDAVSPGEPVHLVGHDWGSIQAWEAVTEPGAARRIASFTSISGPCLDHMAYWSRENRARPAVLKQVLRSWYTLAFQVPVLPELLWRALAKQWPAYLRRVEGVRRAGYPGRTVTRDAVRGLSLYRANLRRRLRTPRERRTEIPVQVISPVHDRYVTPATSDGPRRWVPRLWHRRLFAGHWAALLDDGAQVGRMVTELVDFVEGRPESRALARARGKAGPLVVITGGASGIGRATALAFAEAGAEVVARHGVPDVVVNNAGIGHAGSFLATTTDEWRRVLDVNLWGVIHGCRLFGELMAQHGEGGHIVNVASAAAYFPARSLAAYATSKAAVLMLSDCLRAEVGSRGVVVSTICPGLVDTGITRTTTFSGLSAAEQEASRARVSKLYHRRGFPPERVAREILRTVAEGTAAPATVPVTVEAKAALALSRLSPAALRAAVRAF